MWYSKIASRGVNYMHWETKNWQHTSEHLYKQDFHCITTWLEASGTKENILTAELIVPDGDHTPPSQ